MTFKSTNTLIEWSPSTRDPADDIDDSLPELQARSYDLYKNNSLASGVIRCKNKFVVGRGLISRAKVDGEVLGLSRSETNRINRLINNEWDIFSNTPEISRSGTMNLNQLIQQAYPTQLIFGESLFTVANRKRFNSPYTTVLQPILSTMLSNPNYSQNTEKLRSGMSFEDGLITAYHFKLANESTSQIGAPIGKWRSVSKFGKSNTGLQNVIHCLNSTVADQHRGLPLLTPIMTDLKNLSNFVDTTLGVSELAAKLFMVIESPDGDIPVGPRSRSTTTKTANEYEVNGIQGLTLAPGETIKFSDPKSPTSTFSMFMQELIKFVASSVQIPTDILLQWYTTSYSSNVAASQSFSREIDSERATIKRNIIDPVWQRFIYELATQNTIPEMRGFFSDYRIRNAFSHNSTSGVGMSAINPLQNIKSEIAMIDANLKSKHAVVSQMSNGDSDWLDRISEIEYEKKIEQDILGQDENE